jgi:hypothetical protein
MRIDEDDRLIPETGIDADLIDYLIRRGLDPYDRRPWECDAHGFDVGPAGTLPVEVTYFHPDPESDTADQETRLTVTVAVRWQMGGLGTRHDVVHADSGTPIVDYLDEQWVRLHEQRTGEPHYDPLPPPPKPDGPRHRGDPPTTEVIDWN